MYANTNYYSSKSFSTSKFTLRELRLLNDYGSTIKYCKKDFVYFEETKTNKVFLLKKGLIKIGNFTDDQKEIVKSIIYPAQLFGELGLIYEKKHRNFAQCLTKEVEVVVLQTSTLQHLISQDYILNQKIMAQVGQRLYKVERQLEAFLFKNAKERIIDLLKNIANEMGVVNGKEIIIESMFSQQDIGSITGTSRQTVHTVLSNLRNSNQISVNRKTIIIKDFDRLS